MGSVGESTVGDVGGRDGGGVNRLSRCNGGNSEIGDSHGEELPWDWSEKVAGKNWPGESGDEVMSIGLSL